MSPNSHHTHLLFVCTSNLQRSPTAAGIFADDPRYETAAAGVDSLSQRVVEQGLINWADVIFVMEEWQKEYIEEKFDTRDTPVYNLNIADHFMRGDPVLVQLLRERIGPHLKEKTGEPE